MAEETSNVTLEDFRQEQAENSTFNFQAIYKALVLNWYWFILSLIIFLGGAYIYLRYSTPTYQVQTKLLVKDDDSKNGGMSSSLANASASTLGLISNSNGIDNEIEILQSHTLAAQVARDLKLYVSYQRKGRVKNMILYKDQPVSVDIDPGHLEKLNQPIQLTVKRNGNSYEVDGTYCVPIDEQDFEGPFSITKKFASLPAQISTRAGLITLSQNGMNYMKDGDVELVSIVSPQMASNQLVSELSVSQTSKTTTIAQLTVVDPVPRRAIDFLNQLAVDYNRQANDDKNQIALKTEKFINSRLEKINSELGQTEGQLQDFKERNKMIELKANATSALSNQDESFKQLREMDTQVELLHSIRSFMNQRGNRFQVIPSNVGLSDQSSTALINKYNELVLERNRLLRSAAPNSPVVEPITDQINDMYYNIRQAIDQALQALEIQRGALESMNQKYDTQVAETPQQERILTQIGRQQEVKSGLYLMLLQKREENSISLAATADKGKLLICRSLQVRWHQRQPSLVLRDFCSVSVCRHLLSSSSASSATRLKVTLMWQNSQNCLSSPTWLSQAMQQRQRPTSLYMPTRTTLWRKSSGQYVPTCSSCSKRNRKLSCLRQRHRAKERHLHVPTQLFRSHCWVRRYLWSDLMYVSRVSQSCSR